MKESLASSVIAQVEGKQEQLQAIIWNKRNSLEKRLQALKDLDAEVGHEGDAYDQAALDDYMKQSSDDGLDDEIAKANEAAGDIEDDLNAAIQALKTAKQHIMKSMNPASDDKDNVVSSKEIKLISWLKDAVDEIKSMVDGYDESRSTVEAKAKWHDAEQGYELRDGDEVLGAIATDNPGSWQAYVGSDQDGYPINRKSLPSAGDAAAAVEDKLGIDADRSEIPDEEDESVTVVQPKGESMTKARDILDMLEEGEPTEPTDQGGVTGDDVKEITCKECGNKFKVADNARSAAGCSCPKCGAQAQGADTTGSASDGIPVKTD